MDRRIQKTRAAIQKAYFELMDEKKTPRVSVTAIAQRANIDRKTFYLHYSCVEDIVREFSQDKIQELLAALELDGFFDHPFDVATLFRELNVFIEEDIDFYRHIAANESYDFFWKQFQQVLIGTMQSVYGDVDDHARVEVYTRYIASGFVTVYRSWLKKEIPLSLEQLSQAVRDVSFFGVQRVLQEFGGEADAAAARD